MVACVIRTLLVGDCMPAIEALKQHATDRVDLQVTRLPHLSHEASRLQTVGHDIAVINLPRQDADRLNIITLLHEQAPWLPILLIDDGIEPSLMARAIRYGAEDVIHPPLINPEGLLRAMLISIERKRSVENRILNARRDELTGLGNQRLLEERFGRAIARADRHDTLVALVAIELDQSSQFSTSVEQSIDTILPIIGERLTREIRQTDTLARTRHVGFTWLVEELKSINDVDILVGRLPELLTTSLYAAGREVLITASVGVAVSPFHGRDFKTLLDLAEAAMIDVASLNGDGLLMPPLPPAIERIRTTPLF